MKTLQEVRNEIDRVDNELVSLLEERVALSLKVKEIKVQDQTAVLDSSREQDIIERLQSGLNEEHHAYIKAIYGLIFDYSRLLQNK